MAVAPFQRDPYLTGLMLAYKNESAAYLADIVAPYRSVNGSLYQWDQLELETFYEFQDDLVGRLSAPNRVSTRSTRKEASTRDHGLESPVPESDVKEYQGVGPSPEAIATMLVAELGKINREKRVSDIVFNGANYPTGLKETLSGTSQFSNPASTPISKIRTALNAPIVRPNSLVFGMSGWTDFSSNPEVVEAIRGTGAGGTNARGIVTREEVARLFEVKNVLVGESRGRATPRNVDAAPSTPARLWGKHLALITIDPMAQLKNSMIPTFLLTARFGTPFAGRIVDPNMGLEGGYWVRGGEKVNETIISQECNYFFENAFA
jgi:hypothetical protein